MSEEKKSNVYILAFDNEERSSDFMKGLLTGLPDSAVTDFKSPWDGLIFLKSPLSADELSKCINQHTSNMSHFVNEITNERQGILSKKYWDYLKDDSKKASEEKK